ncbi:MAG: integrase [Schlesneria sp.]|nr:integrase [Schlesneria sp.]
MAYLYKKSRSPFWYVVYFDADRKEVHRSTGLRADDPNDTAKAKALRAELEAKEHHRVPVVNKESWDAWVPKYLERHCETKRTLERYTGNWKWLSLWLQTQRLHSSRAITYRNALEYIEWRTTFKKKSGRSVGRNTAVMELKLLAMILGEAVRLGHAESNPLLSLKLKRDKSAKKPELTDEDITVIREALKTEPVWMQFAFEISLHTGCRLRETRLPLECLDFAENKITFPSPKGGEDRAFSIPMPSALRPLLERIRKSKRKFTLELPFQPSRRWQQFFIKIKKPHLCFHCLRVTYVNRLRRAGVPREVAMRLVNHASELVHQVYQREKVDDVAQWRDAVQFPA